MILLWILNAVALLIVAYLLPGIVVTGFGSALLAAVVLGLLNMLVKPVLILFVVNALVFWFAGSILSGFKVEGFWWAVIGAILYSVISGLLARLTGA